MSLVVLAGGAGAARFLRGLVKAVPPREITVVGNTGDDIEMYGVRVCPDLDIVTYALAGLWDEERGFGLIGDTHRRIDAMRAAGEETWFGLGDGDLATCQTRSNLLAEGVPLHECVARLASQLSIKPRLIPMTNDDVHTVITTRDGRSLHFQEYWVRDRATHEVASIHLHGADAATPAPGVLEAIASAETIVFAPSNPVVSIGTILSVPGITTAIAASPARKVAISPIVGGRVVRGMADKLLPAVDVEVSARGVAGMYVDLIDTFVFDITDEKQTDDIAALGMQAVTAQTMMHSPADAEALARVALGAVK